MTAVKTLTERIAEAHAALKQARMDGRCDRIVEAAQALDALLDQLPRKQRPTDRSATPTTANPSNPAS